MINKYRIGTFMTQWRIMDNDTNKSICTCYTSRKHAETILAALQNVESHNSAVALWIEYGNAIVNGFGAQWFYDNFNLVNAVIAHYLPPPNKSFNFDPPRLQEPVVSAAFGLKENICEKRISNMQS
jgi:hypothetical protein